MFRRYVGRTATIGVLLWTTFLFYGYYFLIPIEARSLMFEGYCFCVVTHVLISIGNWGSKEQVKKEDTGFGTEHHHEY